MATRPEVLTLTEGMPTLTLGPGEVLFGATDTARTVAVLIEGRLQVDAAGTTLAVIDVPGAFVGEMGPLLNVARTATVTALAPTRVHLIGDPAAFFHDHPELGLELARQLAGRLHRLVSYLSDVRSQYADQEGHLGMIDTVLGRLSARPPVDIEPGSDRSPDY